MLVGDLSLSTNMHQSTLPHCIEVIIEWEREKAKAGRMTVMGFIEDGERGAEHSFYYPGSASRGKPYPALRASAVRSA